MKPFYFVFIALLLISHAQFAQQEEVQLNNKGLELLGREEFKKALPIFEQLVNGDSTNIIYRNNRAVCYFNLKMYRKALNDYLFLLNEDPESADFAFYVGNSYEQLENLPLSVDYYSKAIQLEGDRYLYFFKRGTALLKQKEFADAIPDFTRALELNPAHDNSYHNRGLAFYASGNSQKACADWCEAALLGNSTSQLHLTKNCKNNPPRCKK